MMAGTLLVLVFTFSCSSDDGGRGGGNSGNELSYNYCIIAGNTCLIGPFTVSTCAGQPSNNCPYIGSSSSVAGGSSATTSNTFTDTRDGKTYRIETSGSYTWMAENLRFGSGLYNQDGAKTACPSGWRLPNNSELSILQGNFGNGSNFIMNDSLWRANGVWYVNNGKISTADCGVNYNDSRCQNAAGSACNNTDPCHYLKYYNIRCVKNQSVATSSSSVKISSSSSKPSSSSVTYTLTCGSVPTSGTEGTAITPPTVTCNGTAVSSGLNWRNAPNWTNPVAGSYNGISVSVDSGNCSGKTTTCGGILIVYGTPVTYEGEIYQTVVIGTQTWFQRNLNYAVEGSKCYDNSEANCVIYGRLYNWSTAMALPSSCNYSVCGSQIDTKHQGICPSGWHIPSNADWDKLYRYIDGDAGTSSPYGSKTAGRYLKATSGWNSKGNGQDTYGFSALPGGHGFFDRGFNYVGDESVWLSSSETSGGYYFYLRNINYDEDNARSGTFEKYCEFSVRCVQD